MEGAERFFGEPALDLADILAQRPDGKGTVHVLAAEKLIQSPRLYSAFLLWLMSELWEVLPEIGDPEKPKLVFFFDEAHLLFRDAPKELLQKVEQVVRLIRSKGVGIYFVTQSPSDVPDAVLAQLGNRVQHALRAYTPTDQKAVKAAAASFRANPGVDVAKEIQELNVGEALVSTLDEKGAPTPVARTKIRPPNSQVGPVLLEKRKTIIADCDLRTKYEKTVDPESAHEILTKRSERAAQDAADADARAEHEKQRAAEEKARSRAPARSSSSSASRARASSRATPVERVGGKVASGVLNTIARELMRGILGTPRRRRAGTCLARIRAQRPTSTFAELALGQTAGTDRGGFVEFRSVLLWVSSLAVCAGMVALSIFMMPAGGALGLLGGGLGIIAGFMRPGQTSAGERLGNAYVVGLFGLTVGFLIGGLAMAAFALWAPR